MDGTCSNSSFSHDKNDVLTLEKLNKAKDLLVRRPLNIFKGGMDFTSIKIHESPLIPKHFIVTKEPSLLDLQSGNILFRLFHPPPKCREEKEVRAFVFKPPSHVNCRCVLAVNPDIYDMMRKATELKSGA